MRRLYWYNIDEDDFTLSNKINFYQSMGGLGLTTQETKITGGSNKEDNQLWGMLSSKVKYTFKDIEWAQNRLVTVRQMLKESAEEESISKQPFITSGRPYFYHHTKQGDALRKIVKDQPHFHSGEDGKEVLNWEIAPLQVVPFYDGELDKELGYWEMFEEQGYIYGLDKRTLEIHELQHLVIEMKKPLSEVMLKHELYFISNNDVNDPQDIINALPLMTIVEDAADWVRNIAAQNFDVRIKRVNVLSSATEKITVERYK